MALDFYSSRKLYRVMYDDRMEVAPTWWLDTFFGGEAYMSTTEEIIFDKLPSRRKIAPFMLPNAQGKPIYTRQGETLTSFKPAYTKPKDAIRPSEMLRRTPGEILPGALTGGLGLTPKQRYDAEVIRIAQYHRNAITRLWDYMAAKAILDGQITVNYAADQTTALPSVTVLFGRDAGQTVTLGAGSRWGDVGISIMGQIQTWSSLMAAAAFGGTPTKIIMGATAAAAFRASAEIKDLLDTRYIGTDGINITRGIVTTGDPEQPAVMLGTLGPNLQVWVYSGTFQNNDGSVANIMDPRDIVLTAPGIEGLKCFGAILDEDAGIEPIDIFPKMWSEKDPSARFIMSQSAPLMIPVNPNRTMRVRVVA